ncbi:MULTISPECIES: hypothetical protein [Bradyrhizobium]|uniref:hypothetical protein n=1 Tax=Bradyrhizobium elkanii TaxID=29448 RepID=UPI00271505FD|nr:hypothetical protein [Bradyrhizobium elkanii]WLA47291.1 hypothetical protein QIH80_37310 [Bradyrhizobium elkanii]WLB82413.1 hypothetical protein QIH83_07465 [Bradyrhizobium elkanii]
MPPVVRLKRSKPVKILPEVKDLHRIRALRKELARDLDLARVGESRPMGARARHLARLELDYARRYGRAPDIR